MFFNILPTQLVCVTRKFLAVYVKMSKKLIYTWSLYDLIFYTHGCGPDLHFNVRH